MAIGLRAAGASIGATGTVTVQLPVGWQPGDMHVMVVVTKGAPPVLQTVTGWNALPANEKDLAGGAGADAIDSGPARICFIWRIAQAGDTAPSVAFSSAPSQAAAVIIGYTKAAGEEWSIDNTCGADTTASATSYSATGQRAISVRDGDWLGVGTGLNNDTGSLTSRTATLPGATVGTAAVRTNFVVWNAGNDCRLDVVDYPITGGPATGAPTMAFVQAGSAANNAGASVFYRLRVGTPYAYKNRQENAGTTGATTPATVAPSLPSGTLGGHGRYVLVAIAADGQTIPAPLGWTLDASGAVSTLNFYCFRKPAVDAETAWTFTPAATCSMAWWVREVAGLSEPTPKDVAQAASGASAGTTQTTGTTGTTAQANELALALFGWTVAAGTSAAVTSYTNSFGEDADVQTSKGAGSNVGLAVADKQLTATGTVESTATWGASVAARLGIALTYRTGAITLVNLSGWRHGYISTAGMGAGVAAGRYFDQSSGPMAAVSVTLPDGTTGYVLRQNRAAAGGYLGWTIGGGLGAANRYCVVRAYFRVDSVTTNGTLWSFGGPGESPLYRIRYTSAGLIEVYDQTGNTVGATSATTVALGTWFRLDLRMDMGATTHTVDWQLDGVDQPTATFAGKAAVTTDWVWIGALTAQTIDQYTTNVAVSQNAADYPIGPGKTVILTVDPAGTVTLGGGAVAADFNTFTANGTLAAWDATVARDALEELPPTIGASADGVAQVTAAVGNPDYIQIPMTSYALAPGESINGARMLVVGWAASATANTAGWRSWNGTTETTLWAAADPGFDATADPAWMARMLTLADVATQALLDALEFRFGFSTDVAPVPGMDALYAELDVAIPAAPTGATFPVNVAGSLTGAGAVTRTLTRPLAGSSTGAGVLTRTIATAKAGTIATSGAVRRTLTRVLLASLVTSGTLTAALVRLRLFAGSLTGSGVMTRTLARLLTATVAGSGVLRRTPLLVRSGTISSSGSITRTLSRALSGTLTGAGILTGTRTRLAFLTGSVTGAGLLTRLPLLVRAGTLAGSGVLRRTPTRVLTGTLTGSGVLTRILTLVRVLTATIAATGALVRLPLLARAGTLTGSGALVRAPLRKLTGTITGVGSITRSLSRALSGSLTGAGTLLSIRTRLAFLSGSLTGAGVLVRTPLLVRAGALAGSGVLVRSPLRKLTGSLTGSGLLTRTLTRALAGSVTGAGVMTRTAGVITRTFTGSLTGSGVLRRTVVAVRAGTLAPAGALTRTLARTLTGTLTGAGALASVKVRLVTIAGTLAGSSILRRTISTARAGTLAGSGALVRAPLRKLTGTATPAGAVVVLRSFLRSFAGSSTAAGTVRRTLTRPIAATITAAGTLTRSPLRKLTGTLTPSGVMTRIAAAVTRTFTGSLTATGTLRRTLARTSGGTLAATGSLLRALSRTVTGSLPAQGTLARTLPARTAGFLAPGGSLITFAVPRGALFLRAELAARAWGARSAARAWTAGAAARARTARLRMRSWSAADTIRGWAAWIRKL